MPEKIHWNLNDEPSPSAHELWHVIRHNAWKRRMRHTQVVNQGEDEVDSGYPDRSSASYQRLDDGEGSQRLSNESEQESKEQQDDQNARKRDVVVNVHSKRLVEENKGVDRGGNTSIIS